MICRLKGRSNKGKQRIKQFGELWKAEDAVWINPMPSTKFITSVSCEGSQFTNPSGRWLKDEDFEVIDV
tara:strand:+ start:1599 stop:1805 length:207 start_codon:yes stop_codon:yes gene_type:complete